MSLTSPRLGPPHDAPTQIASAGESINRNNGLNYTVARHNTRDRGSPRVRAAASRAMSSYAKSPMYGVMSKEVEKPLQGLAPT